MRTSTAKALFLAALDEDAAAAISKVAIVDDESVDHRWRDGLLFSLVGSVSRHPWPVLCWPTTSRMCLIRVVDLPAPGRAAQGGGGPAGVEQSEGTVRQGIDAARWLVPGWCRSSCRC